MPNTSPILAAVDFHGQSLTVLTSATGEHLVAMKPICEAIGLQWEAQLKRIKRHPVLSICMSIMDIQIPGDDQHRELVCLPLDYLNGWLFGVDASRVKPEIRERLVQYQRECFAALAAYWQQGEAVNPRTTATATPAEPIHLTYNDRPFRIVPEGAALWFVAVDMARALDMRDGHCLTRHLRSEHKALRQVGHRRLGLIDRAGLELALHHASPARAEPFRLWLEAALEQFVTGTAPAHALPGGLSGDQQSAIKTLVAARIETVPETVRGKAATLCWSALKAKFGCGYKEIAPEQFTEAVSLVARIVLEGELLEPEAPKVLGRLPIDFPIEDWKARNPHQFRHDNPNSAELTLTTGDLLLSEYSPGEVLLEQLREAGYRVDGPLYELRALRSLAKRLDVTMRLMAGNVRQALDSFEHDHRRVQRFEGAKEKR
ncbi:BRO family, N-terminal domain [Azotobacter beijerinckii]|uniref:BRO family, N-terminal domain n=1 Tax=Azotobacter beijerinckii TaxID=170623 RepID=A0A1H9MBR6_9GAMM|nr:phage antirepressor N-terminal domain-containing protein [Azotobacter beijerinckii]SER21072.1 BRO family, N-terminal domain [Azotobacter beijerinckii]